MALQYSRMDLSFDPLWQSTQISGPIAYIPWTPMQSMELSLSSPQLFSQSALQAFSLATTFPSATTSPVSDLFYMSLTSPMHHATISSLEIRSDDSDNDTNDEENDTSELFIRSNETWIQDIQALETAMNSGEPTDREVNSPPTTISNSQTMTSQVANALRFLATQTDNSIKARQTQDESKLTTKLQTANELIQGLISENGQIKDENKKLLIQIKQLTVELTTMKTQPETQSELLEERGNSLAIEHSQRTRLEAHIATEETKQALVIWALYSETLMKASTITQKWWHSVEQRQPKSSMILKWEAANDTARWQCSRVRTKSVVTSGKLMKPSWLWRTIKVAKELAASVAICELPPRINTQEATASMKAPNTKLKDLAD